MCAGRALPSPVPAPPPINSAPQGARIERPPSAPRRRLLTAPRRGAAPPAPRAAPPRRRAGPRARWAPRHSRGCTCHPKEKEARTAVLEVAKGIGTPMSLKSPAGPILGLSGPLAARRGRPGNGRGSPAAQRLGEGPSSRPLAWMPGGVRSTSQGCEVSSCKLCFT